MPHPTRRRAWFSASTVLLLLLGLVTPAAAETDNERDARQFREWAADYQQKADALKARMGEFRGPKQEAAQTLYNLYLKGAFVKGSIATHYARGESQMARNNFALYNSDLRPKIEAAEKRFADAANLKETPLMDAATAVVDRHDDRQDRRRERLEKLRELQAKDTPTLPAAGNFDDTSGGGSTVATALHAKVGPNPGADRDLADIRKEADALRAALLAAAKD